MSNLTLLSTYSNYVKKTKILYSKKKKTVKPFTKFYYFYPNIKIDAVYGNPQFCIWDGGRVFQQYRHGSIEEISFIIDKYNNEYDIPIRYIFTNPLLKEEHYHDRFCNKIVEIGNNYHNEIVINDNNLMFYLKQSGIWKWELVFSLLMNE